MSFFLTRSWLSPARWKLLICIWTLCWNVNKCVKFHFPNYSAFRNVTPKKTPRVGVEPWLCTDISKRIASCENFIRLMPVCRTRSLCAMCRTMMCYYHKKVSDRTALVIFFYLPLKIFRAIWYTAKNESSGEKVHQVRILFISCPSAEPAHYARCVEQWCTISIKKSQT